MAEGCVDLGSQAEQVAQGQRCEAAWNSESLGYYMEEAKAGCGNAVGWISWWGDAQAFCRGCTLCSNRGG